MGFHKRHLHITYTSGSGFFGVVQKGKARVKVTDQGRDAKQKEEIQRSIPTSMKILYEFIRTNIQRCLLLLTIS